MIVVTSDARPFAAVDRVGVAITVTGPEQLHCGFVYRLDDDPPLLVHLRWHHMLSRAGEGEEWGLSPDYMWADVAELEAEDRRVLAGFLSLVGGENPKIPYGLDSEGIEFDPATGELRPPPDGRGLTCSSFLLAVFRTMGHTVLDEDGWPVGREGDAKWQARIIGHLEHTAPEHAQRVAADLSCARFRPEEVVGASAYEGWPHNFPQAEALGGEVIQDMKAAGKLD